MSKEKTLRDEMAMAALTGFMSFLSHPESGGFVDTDANRVAEISYKLADAMMKAKEGIYG